MKPTQITYQKNFHTDLKDRFMMETLSITVSMDDADTTVKAFAFAKERLEQAHKDNNPHLFVPRESQQITPVNHPYAPDEDMRGTKVVDVTKPTNNETEPKPLPLKKPTVVEAMIKSIEECNLMEKPNGLLSFEKVANSNPAVKAAYDLRLKLLKKKS